MVTATALALPAETPKLIAPAMNTKMYENPLTQRNLSILKEVGYEEIEPRSSLLACGDLGRGALAELDTIIEHIENVYNFTLVKTPVNLYNVLGFQNRSQKVIS